MFYFTTRAVIAAIAVGTFSLVGPGIAMGSVFNSAVTQVAATSATVTAQGLDAAVCVRTVNGAPIIPSAVVESCTGVATQTPSTVTAPLLPSPITAGQRPGPTNTGPADDTAFRQINGDLILSRAGEVLDSVQVNGTIRVTAPNVTIKNSYVAGRPGLAWGQPLIYAGTGSSAGLVIENSVIAPSDPSWVVNGIFGFGFTARAIDVHSVIDAVHIFGSDVSIEGSWLHDPYHGPDSGQPDKVTHDDSIQIGKGANIVILGNSMSGAYNAVIQITQGIGPVSNVIIANNWVAGGACSLNIAEGSELIREFSVQNNRFGTSRYTCPILVSPAMKAASTFSANVWESNLTAVHFTCRDPSVPNWRC